MKNKIKISWTKLNHADRITINKLQYVKDEALYCGLTAPTQIIINKHLQNIKYYECLGEYSLNQDKICLLSDGLKYFIATNNTSIEKQTAKTISHEIIHRILFYEHGENECRAFDNIAEKLKAYGTW